MIPNLIAANRSGKGISMQPRQKTTKLSKKSIMFFHKIDCDYLDSNPLFSGRI